MSTQHEALKLAEILPQFGGATCVQAAAMLRQQHALIVQMAEALENAHDHLDMHSLRVSHCNDAARITGSIAVAKDYLK